MSTYNKDNIITIIINFRLPILLFSRILNLTLRKFAKVI